jgi:hypothetical protein
MEWLAVYVYLSRDVWLILEFKNSGMLSINNVKARATFSGFDKTLHFKLDFVREKSVFPLWYNQQDATFSRYMYFCQLFYMFQAVPPPIIRSTKLYIQRQVLSNQ